MVNSHQEYLKIIEILEREGRRPKLLLHVCCAPCSTSVLERLKEHFDVTLYFYNPNIFPKSEYDLRAESLEKYILERGYAIKIEREGYDYENFMRMAQSKSEAKEGGLRCKGCFAQRLKKTALKARHEGYEYFTTSISVSPHKNEKWINELGSHFETLYGVKFLVADFKKQNGFRESVTLSKTYDVYRQDYCGCLYSKLARIELSPQVKFVLEKLKSFGEGYLVGGCVRDMLLGREPKDYDFATNLSLEKVVEIFAQNRPKIMGKSFEIVQICVEEHFFEIARFRSEKGILDGRHPEHIEFVDTIEQDLARRDFTINAFAYNKERGLIDPFKGVEDLMKGKISTVGEPKLRFEEDFLRILRAVRFSTEFDFEIEERTFAELKGLGHRVKALSVERISQEFYKILLSKNVKNGLNLLSESGILTHIIPEFSACIGFNQKAKHQCFELHEHIFTVVEYTPPILALRLAALFHDISKPLCQEVREDGFAKYRNHAELSAQMGETILKRLGVSSSLIKECVEYIKRHSSWRAFSRSHIKKEIFEIGVEKYRHLIALFRADVYGKCQPHCFKLFDDMEVELEDIIEKKDPIFLSDLAIKGDDLALYFRGKEIGEHLLTCLHWVWEVPDENIKAHLLEKILMK